MRPSFDQSPASALLCLSLLVLPGMPLAACPAVHRGGGGDDDAGDDDTGDDDVAFDPSGLPQGPAAPRAPVRATVDYVLDGDTATMTLDDWGEHQIRFLNINTPEMSGPDCWAVEATERTRELLPEGTVVWLTWDGELEDPFDRLLCHIFEGEAPTQDDWVNLQLVSEGHAEAYIFEANSTFEDYFYDAEWAARQADLGMWGACY